MTFTLAATKGQFVKNKNERRKQQTAMTTKINTSLRSIGYMNLFID